MCHYRLGQRLSQKERRMSQNLSGARGSAEFGVCSLVARPQSRSSPIVSPSLLVRVAIDHVELSGNIIVLLMSLDLPALGPRMRLVRSVERRTRIVSGEAITNSFIKAISFRLRIETSGRPRGTSVPWYAPRLTTGAQLGELIVRPGNRIHTVMWEDGETLASPLSASLILHCATFVAAWQFFSGGERARFSRNRRNRMALPRATTKYTRRPLTSVLPSCVSRQVAGSLVTSTPRGVQRLEGRKTATPTGSRYTNHLQEVFIGILDPPALSLFGSSPDTFTPRKGVKNALWTRKKSLSQWEGPGFGSPTAANHMVAVNGWGLPVMGGGKRILARK